MENSNKLSTDPILKLDQISSQLLKNCIQESVLHITSKKNQTNKTLTFLLNYKRNSKMNPLNYDLFFSLILDLDFPKSVPTINSLTHFSYPTMFDNRNLIFSIISHNWVTKHSEKESDVLTSLEEIIMNIPKFVGRLIENTTNKILVYYGDYKIDSIYDINDFLSNSELDFFRVEQQVKKDRMKERYIVVTDVYLLLFDPVPSGKNLAKLLFWGDLRQLQTKNEDNYLSLEWKNKDKVITFSILFRDNEKDKFREKSKTKSNRLQEFYKIFQDDITKPTNEEIVSNLNDLNSSDLDKLILLVKYKEELLSNSYSLNFVTELMALYQKIIEILSAKGDDFSVYLEKLHKMLLEKETAEKMENLTLGSNGDTDYTINDDD